MDVFVKAIRFKKLPMHDLIAFLAAHPKTQVVRAGAVFGKRHVLSSVSETLKAFRGRKNIAKKEELEFLVRLCAERRISDALKRGKVARDSVFICWARNPARSYADFKKKFSFTEVKLKEPALEKQFNAIQRTATFWLST